MWHGGGVRMYCGRGGTASSHPSGGVVYGGVVYGGVVYGGVVYGGVAYGGVA